MVSEWPSVPLSELTAVPATYGVVQPGANAPGGIPMLRVNNFQGDSLNLVDVMRIAPAIESKYERTRIKAGDVLITIVGSVGQVAVVPEALNGWNIARAVAMIRPETPELSRWISFVLRSPDAQHQLGVAANTTVQTTINLKDLRALQIPLPDRSTRAEITEILGALDDRIANLHETNATLHAIAGTLFKSWFVDFDGVPQEDMQESELGLIPKECRVTTIGEELRPLLGGTPSRAKPEYWSNGTVAWINSGEVNEFRIIEPTELITQAALENSAAKLVPPRTTVLAITGATLGQVSIAEIQCCANQSVVAIPATSEFPTEFIYLWILNNIQKLISAQTGGAQQHINKGNVEALPLLRPSATAMERYHELSKPLFDKIANNCFQAATLAQLRETLLPRLISGQLRVSQ